MARLLELYDIDEEELFYKELLYVLSVVITTLFGGLSLVAWNYSFPTPIESLLWRISCVSMLALPIIFATSAKIMGRSKNVYYHLAMGAIGFIYAVVRLYVIVECFLAFRSEPAAVYCAVRWSNYLPHV